MSLALIRRAFETTLQTWGSAQSVTILFENVTAEKPETAYAEAFVLPAPTQSQGIGRTHRGYTGVFQVSLSLPQNAGPGAAATLAASLDTAFPLNAPITVGGLEVWLTSPMSAAPALPDASRYRVPVSASYLANTI